MKKKGFTLIELLAVIVVLAIIALIAVPIVLNIINKAREGAAISSARNYIKAVESYQIISDLDSSKEALKANKEYQVAELNNLIDLKGTKPANGSVNISNNSDVESATLTINGYIISYDGNNYNIVGKDNILYVTNINLNKTNLTLLVDDTYNLIAEVLPSNANDKKITWTSSDESIATVDKDGLVTAKKIGSTIVTVKSSNGIKNECKITVKGKYKETLLNGTDPVLKNGLIPVTIANDGKVTYAPLYEEWYKYQDKKWANAVMIKENPSKNYKTSDVILEEDIESYFVWIPKYSYKLFDLGNYDSVPESDKAMGNAKTIDIKFGTTNTSNTTSECVTPLTSGETGTCSVGKYMTHPAFITMNTNGLWVGKFETGYKGATSTSEAEVNSQDSSKIIVKPNVYSWSSNTVSNMFIAAYNYKRNLDSHMMKNTEWGAVAYLSHSIYGINKEVNINNNSARKTGYSGLPTLDQSSYPGTYGDGASYNTAYNTSNGYLASTTGNISGIYDMSSGAHEYMSSYMSGQLGSSGFTTDTISAYNSKYFDEYSSSSGITSYNQRILGDATGEMGPFINYKDADGYNRFHNKWYGDSSDFVDSTYPWFYRGGAYDNGVLAGQFHFNRHTGAASHWLGSRLVLA